MKILVLHGLRETPETSRLVKALKDTGHDIIAPKIDPWNPKRSWEEINMIESDLVIGFSLGGFFASCLTSITPRILINPALDFPNMLRDRKHKREALIEEYDSLPFMEVDPMWIKGIFAMGDEKIGMRGLPLYLEKYSKETITYIQGGHNLTEEEFKENIKDI